ncbi:hypothetical protein EON82_25525 [bacterium]|nr:MAG: hypothetical protein EON82_25525 [bacterium]
MTYAEAVAALERIHEKESERLEARLAARRGPDGMIPKDERPLQERIESMVRESIENPILFHRARRRSRGRLTLAGSHPDGRLRWVGSILLEGSPEHPNWQATLAAADPLTEEEMAEDDWFIESYDPMDF